MLRCAIVRAVSRQAVADSFELAVGIESGHGDSLRLGGKSGRGEWCALQQGSEGVIIGG